MARCRKPARRLNRSRACRSAAPGRWHSRIPRRRPRQWPGQTRRRARAACAPPRHSPRSEEHTSELQSRRDLVCRLLLEKKKKIKKIQRQKKEKKKKKKKN